MLHTTPQRVRPTMSNRSSVLLRTSFAWIRRIYLFITFAILAVCYTWHQIDQKDSNTLRYNLVQTSKQAREILLPPSTLRLIYLLYKLFHKPDGLPPSGTFTTCSIAKYWIGQTDIHCLILDGFTICNQLGLDGDQGHGQHLIYTPCWFNLQAS